MPRVSQAEAKKTRQAILDAAFKILLLEGHEHLTYTRVAEKTGVSRSCVNGHFKRKEALLDELKPKAFEHIIQALEFSSADDFYRSWLTAVNEDRMFRNLIQNVGEMICSPDGRRALLERILGDSIEAEKALYMAIGYAVVHIRCGTP